MSDAKNQNYLDVGYDNLLQRSDNLAFTLGQDAQVLANVGTKQEAAGGSAQINTAVAPTPSSGAVETMPVKSDGSMGDVWIRNFIRSENWKPKSVGFYINGQTGYAEFSQVFVSGTIIATLGMIGGFTIGATDLSASAGGNTTILSSGPTAFSAGPTGSPTVYITQAGQLVATAGSIGGVIITATAMSSDPFVSGPLGVGWRIQSGGAAEFQNVIIRGSIRTSVFEKETISAVNGILLVSPSDVLAADMTALDASTLTISGQTTFSANEVIRIKDGTDDEWMLVTNAASAPTYTVTRDLAGSYAPNTNPIWKKGTAVVSMGVGTGTKTGFVLLDSSSSNSPFIDVYGRNSNTYSDYTIHGRFGWLKGITDSDVGLSSTDVWGLYTDNAYIKGVIVANSGRIGGTTGWAISANSITSGSGATTVGLDNTVTVGDDVRIYAGSATPSSAPFRITESGALVSTNATITGVINATSGYFGNVTNGVTIDSTGLVLAGSGRIGTNVSPNARVELVKSISGGFTDALMVYDSANANTFRLFAGGGFPSLTMFNSNSPLAQFIGGASGSDYVVKIEASSTDDGLEVNLSGTRSTTVAGVRVSLASTLGIGFNLVKSGGIVGDAYSVTPDNSTNKLGNIFKRTNPGSGWTGTLHEARITDEGYIQFPQYCHRSEFDEYLGGGSLALASSVIAKAYWVGGGTSGTQDLISDSTADKNTYILLSTTSTASRSSTLTFGRFMEIQERVVEFRIRVSSKTNTAMHWGFYDGSANYAWFNFDTAVDADNIYAECYNGTLTRTDTTADISTTSWNVFRIVQYAGPFTYFYINDVLMATIQNNTSTSAMKPYVYIDNKAASEEKTLYLDFVNIWRGRDDTSSV